MFCVRESLTTRPVLLAGLSRALCTSSAAYRTRRAGRSTPGGTSQPASHASATTVITVVAGASAIGTQGCQALSGSGWGAPSLSRNEPEQTNTWACAALGRRQARACVCVRVYVCACVTACVCAYVRAYVRAYCCPQAQARARYSAEPQRCVARCTRPSTMGQGRVRLGWHGAQDPQMAWRARQGYRGREASHNNKHELIFAHAAPGRGSTRATAWWQGARDARGAPCCERLLHRQRPGAQASRECALDPAPPSARLTQRALLLRAEGFPTRGLSRGRHRHGRAAVVLRRLPL